MFLTAIRTDKAGVGRTLVLSLAWVYLLVAFSYIFFLPKFNHNFSGINDHSGFVIRQAPVNHGVSPDINSSAKLVQPVFKGQAGNKHGLLNNILPLIMLFSALVLSGHAFKAFRKNGSGPNDSFHTSQYSYLYLRSLRI
jgi:hypothetical protein